jgi:SpoVK/Ycf46/Vps4 family AAA+-type ATPase
LPCSRSKREESIPVLQQTCTNIDAFHCRARASSPSVIFFDELDGMVTSRTVEGNGGVDVTDRVLSQLLQEMDGLKVRIAVATIW